MKEKNGRKERSVERDPRCRVFLEKQIVMKLAKKFPAFYGTSTYLTVSIGGHNWTLS
jgi:hypothetical protein